MGRAHFTPTPSSPLTDGPRGANLYRLPKSGPLASREWQDNPTLRPNSSTYCPAQPLLKLKDRQKVVKEVYIDCGKGKRIVEKRTRG
jgi:hypothetical protein